MSGVPLEPHFEPMGWGHAGPTPVGTLARFDYDPTYGGTSVHEAADVYECQTCGALVTRPEKHARWHGPVIDEEAILNDIDPLGQA